MSKIDDTPPAEKFFNEIYSVFLRWWEESDLDEEDMAGLATQAIEKFTESTVEFESDIDLSNTDD
jgi:hypothetical protein